MPTYRNHRSNSHSAASTQRAAFAINGVMRLGVQFSGKTGFLFWLPKDDRLYRWDGYDWEEIPATNMGAKRRAALVKVWRGCVKNES